MKKHVELPKIPEEENTPLVQTLVGMIEFLVDKVQKQVEEIGQLRDEINVLKGEKKRPKFTSSKIDKKTDKEDKHLLSKDKPSKRTGSSKKIKNVQLTIHEDKPISPKDIPENSRFKGYRDFVVQDLNISPQTTRYRLECWQTPEGKRLVGQLPNVLNGKHFGPTLASYVLYQHPHCQVTQPLLLEQLHEWGISISSEEINHLLTDSKETFHDEKDKLLETGLAISDYVTVDDSGARHKGKNGYVTHIGNDTFAWFESTDSKSKVNFLQCLRAREPGYQINDEALSYLRRSQLPQASLDHLIQSGTHYFSGAHAWEKYLDGLGMINKRHRTIATEGALLGMLFEQGLTHDWVIVSDDAGQFNVLSHGLCWIHTKRLIHKMLPLNDQHRKDIALIRDELWTLYADLKAYKKAPNDVDKNVLETKFDQLFTQKTSYVLLNSLLKCIHANKSELLLVLEQPEIPLHTNGSETDIRDYVKKRKVSGGTHSDLGRKCRDTFASLKKTCRKLDISFWEYLMDRQCNTGNICPLPKLMRIKAENTFASGY